MVLSECLQGLLDVVSDLLERGVVLRDIPVLPPAAVQRLNLGGDHPSSLRLLEREGETYIS